MTTGARCSIPTSLVGAGLLLSTLAGGLRAQGVTGAAIRGWVRGPDSVAIPDASVLVRNTATGERWRAVTSSDGRYGFERVSIGGPYRVEATAIGFAPIAVEPVRLALGEVRTIELVLVPSALGLAPIEVRVEPNPATGPRRTIKSEQLGRLPLLNHDVLDLVRESPQAVRGVFGLSIGGQGTHSNSFQIDGGENTSLAGQFAATPGGFINLNAPPGGGGLRTIALDAVQEIQVLVAPFDVREGSFTGGLINAVTKSGTNQVQGSGYAFVQNQRLAGKDTTLPDFHTVQFGGTVGGPLVHDRLHLFLAADLQASLTPYSGQLIRADTTGGTDSVGTGIRYASATRFQHILSDSFGVDPGAIGPFDSPNPAQSLFGKLTLQAGVNSRMELSQSYVHGSLQGFLAGRDGYVYGLTSTDGRYTNTTTATRLTWNALLGRRASSELVAAYLVVRDRCQPAAAYPLLRVAADAGELQAGKSPICPGRTLAQHALELTGNLTYQRGQHRLLAGTHEELLSFRDPTSLGTSGVWSFSSLDDLAAGRPGDFTAGTTGALRAEGPVADFRVRQVGLYLQDEWTIARGLTLTTGIRMDVPTFPDRPVRNPDLLTSALGIDTGIFPGGHPLWSPRLGLTWSSESGRLALRAGAGLFSGRPPYFFPADAYRSTGLEQYLLACSGDDVPDFTLDPVQQPRACRTSSATPVPRITYVDPAFRFPQELKLSAGLDASLPWGLATTIDLLVSRSRHQPEFVDVNLTPTGQRLAGEGGRVMYGTLEASAAAPNRLVPQFTSVVRQGNGQGNRYVAVSLSLSRRIGRGGNVAASYTYAEARDRMNPDEGLGISLSGLGIAADQIGSTALDGTLERRRLAPSVYDVPHKLRLSGTAELPFGTELSLIYEGSSGSPFTYVIDGDINADGFGPELFGQQSNDPVYVPGAPVPGGDVALVDSTGAPAGAAEYSALAGFVRAERCLRRSAGELLRRNTCRNPWQTQLDASVAKRLVVGGRRTVRLTLDVFNVLHLIDSNWGLVRRTADFGLEEVPLLGLVGFDPAVERGLYRFRPPSVRRVDLGASRWRVQLGTHVDF